ncbi:hypothetical protein V492_04194 [Pseudogymnoascus sp. VKM F-4246]|nr:hypothetical protein V492_04194 [Pseudogymnoascus sp. VKM F-4246]
MAASSPKFDSDEEFQNAIMESAGVKGTSSSPGPASSKNDAHISLVKTSDSPAPWCDEFENMISGMDFDARNAPEMMEHKFRIMQLLHKFNDPARLDEPGITLAKLRSSGAEILKQALGKIGKNSVVETPLYAIFGCNTFIGSTVYANHGLAIHDSAPVTIGDRCHIAPNVTIITESHGVEVAPRRAGLLYARPVSIGDDCWIGTNVVILPGVTIGKGCTIGSCAVVSKNIPDFCVAAGVPARVIKKLEDPDALANGFEE